MHGAAHALLTLRTTVALLGVVAALGCSEAATGPRSVPVGLQVVGDSAQAGVVGAPLDSALTVFVYDKYGQAVPGALVRFSVAAGQGSVDPRTRTTGPDGLARSTWRLPRLTGRYQAHAVAAGLDSLTFTAIARPGRPASVSLANGAALSAPAGAQVDSAVTVLVQDAYGNPVSGAGVSFATREGSGAVVPARALTDSLGHARAVWTLGEARGVHGLVVRADSLEPLQLRATALPAPATPGLTATRLGWTEYGVPVPGGGETVQPGARPAPPTALGCWRNALGEVALEPGGCGEQGVGRLGD